MTDTTIVLELWEIIKERAEHPSDESYVSALLTHPKGIDKPLEKVGEECTEFILAIKNEDYGRKVSEAADLLFHWLVALRAAGVDIDDVLNELKSRRK